MLNSLPDHPNSQDHKFVNVKKSEVSQTLKTDLHFKYMRPLCCYCESLLNFHNTKYFFSIFYVKSNITIITHNLEITLSGRVYLAESILSLVPFFSENVKLVNFAILLGLSISPWEYTNGF